MYLYHHAPWRSRATEEGRPDRGGSGDVWPTQAPGVSPVGPVEGRASGGVEVVRRYGRGPTRRGHGLPDRRPPQARRANVERAGGLGGGGGGAGGDGGPR